MVSRATRKGNELPRRAKFLTAFSHEKFDFYPPASKSWKLSGSAPTSHAQSHFISHLSIFDSYNLSHPGNGLLQLNFQSRKVDETLQSKITNEEWQLEMERVMPSLKLTIQTGN